MYRLPLYALILTLTLGSCVIDFSKAACVYGPNNSCEITSESECKSRDQATFYESESCTNINPAGFCRLLDNCFEQDKLDCLDAGGVFSEAECEAGTSGACQIAGDCIIASQANCESNQGVFSGGNCPGSTGACFQNSNCTVTSETNCNNQGGVYLSGACPATDSGEGACINNSGCTDNVTSCSSGTYLSGQTCLSVTGKCVDFSDEDDCTNTVAANCDFPDDFYIGESCPVYPSGACVDPWDCTDNVTELDCPAGTLVAGGTCSTITGSCVDFFTDDCSITTAAACASEDDFTIDGTCP